MAAILLPKTWPGSQSYMRGRQSGPVLRGGRAPQYILGLRWDSSLDGQCHAWGERSTHSSWWEGQETKPWQWASPLRSPDCGPGSLNTPEGKAEPPQHICLVRMPSSILSPRKCDLTFRPHYKYHLTEEAVPEVPS